MSFGSDASHAPVDPDGLMEFSVVFTDRSLNHMSQKFQHVMRDISSTLKEVYSADHAIVVPGGGTFAMEAVARQFATDKRVMVMRNGWFSYRWSQIFDAGAIPESTTVLKARREKDAHQAPFAPMPLDDVIARIKDEKPDVFFAPHVETSAGVMLPDHYISGIADAMHEVGGLLVIDCVASGTIWLDMEGLGIDVLISAPQKGWSASPCAGLVMLSEGAAEKLESSQSTSFAVDLKKWHQIMQAYLGGGHAYHATMPTDALTVFRDTMIETKHYGFEAIKEQQMTLGKIARASLTARGIKSVAAKGFEAPTVIVSYTDDPAMQNGSKFAAKGMQIAAGVPLECDEPADYSTFRIGLFGLDKLRGIDETVAKLEAVLDKLG